MASDIRDMDVIRARGIGKAIGSMESWLRLDLKRIDEAMRDLEPSYGRDKLKMAVESLKKNMQEVVTELKSENKSTV